jgi:hypothetical protein
MRRLAALLAAALAAAGCATRPPHPEAFSFAVIGDAPYNAREELEFDAMLGRLGAEPLAFVVHVGDFKAGGGSPCTDALYADRKARLDASRHPLVLTPGDNDWADCRRESNGAMDPLERLARLREVFFADGWSLGRSRLPLARQEACAEREGTACACPGLPENRLWTKNRVAFATIHVVGGNDNRGFDAAGDAEQRCRAAASRAWLAGSRSPCSSCTGTRTPTGSTARSATRKAPPWRTRAAWRASAAPWWAGCASPWTRVTRRSSASSRTRGTRRAASLPRLPARARRGRGRGAVPPASPRAPPAPCT